MNTYWLGWCSLVVGQYFVKKILKVIYFVKQGNFGQVRTLTHGTWPLDVSTQRQGTAKRQKEKFILIRLRSWYVAISQSYHSITWILCGCVYRCPGDSSLPVQSLCRTHGLVSYTSEVGKKKHTYEDLMILHIFRRAKSFYCLMFIL